MELIGMGYVPIQHFLIMPNVYQITGQFTPLFSMTDRSFSTGHLNNSHYHVFLIFGYLVCVKLCFIMVLIKGSGLLFFSHGT